MKSTFFQEYLVKLGVITFVVASIIAVFGIPLQAILVSFFASLLFCRIAFAKLWENRGEILGQPHYEIMPAWQKWLWCLLVSAICSQAGWFALLV